MFKNVIKLAVRSLICSSVLMAETYDIKQGWQMVGTISSIDLTKGFSDTCIKIIWNYDNAETNKWSAYSSDNALSNTILNDSTINSMTAIDSKNGFWVYAHNDCTINTEIISTTVAFVSGKTVIIDPNYPSTMTFSENGNYSESGYNGSGQTNPYSCSGKWAYMTTNTVATTCEDSGTTLTPTSSSLSFVFASETIVDGMGVSIYENGTSNTLTETTTVVSSN